MVDARIRRCCAAHKVVVASGPTVMERRCQSRTSSKLALALPNRWEEASLKQIWGRAKISSNTFLYKSPNFKAMPRKKVKAHKKSPAYKVFRLIERNNFEYAQLPEKPPSKDMELDAFPL